ncbi:hypothetical protein [Paraburkholderia sp. J8-2]|uniref:hypothetical protein n=1 Tax=Paraburkholderia sp. J8-2 TaxID=2805440 RepID=UPI002AB60B14|nr:hypothetical protein [Paraburkholderia sp. J8-2]
MNARNDSESTMKSAGNMTVLKKGTALFHGTDCDDFDETTESLNGPAWLSSSRGVAQYFATRPGGWGGTKRVIEYALAEDLELHLVSSQRAMAQLADEHDIAVTGVEEMRESVEASGIPGWVIPGNYADGDDILIVRTDLLDYVGTTPASAGAQGTASKEDA